MWYQDLKFVIKDVFQWILFLFWVLIASSKLVNFQDFRLEMLNQVFPREWVWFLLVFIPLTSLVAAWLVFRDQTLKAGFILSTILMVLYTGYVGLVLMRFFDRVPCSCGGVIKDLSWEEHFYFNLIFTAVAVIGWILTLNERREPMR